MTTSKNPPSMVFQRFDLTGEVVDAGSDLISIFVAAPDFRAWLYGDFITISLFRMQNCYEALAGVIGNQLVNGSVVRLVNRFHNQGKKPSCPG